MRYAIQWSAICGGDSDALAEVAFAAGHFRKKGCCPHLSCGFFSTFGGALGHALGTQADLVAQSTTSIRHLVDAERRIPTILVTAYPNDADRSRALNNGVVCYLRKPVDEDDLKRCVSAVLTAGGTKAGDS
ncbi:hypothetical protein [Mesorhizobium sp. M0408]|uniref:response regulator n=1 Tax=Mesorhizobium sp. M0408 TaxID=2956942 RepID=UPI00333D7C2E